MNYNNGDKMEANIFYSSAPHPTGEIYWGDKHLEVHYNNDPEIKLSRSFFLKHWKRLPVVEEVDITALEVSLELLFVKYNDDYTNPLSYQNGGQDIIKLFKTHTSMSVEDVIEVNGEFYMVGGCGFKRIIWED